MLNFLPLYLRKDPTFKALIDMYQLQMKNMDDIIEDVRKQIFIESATWALPIYEKELGITPNSAITIDERRAIVMARWRATNKIDKSLLEAVAVAILGQPVTVGFDGSIIFEFDMNVKTGIAGLRKIVDDIKPAHLPFSLTAIAAQQPIVVSQISYDFTVSPPICNRFETEVHAALGILSTNILEGSIDTNYSRYEICGLFSAGGI